MNFDLKPLDLDHQFLIGDNYAKSDKYMNMQSAHFLLCRSWDAWTDRSKAE